jgi:hypothetical protein
MQRPQPGLTVRLRVTEVSTPAPVDAAPPE